MSALPSGSAKNAMWFALGRKAPMPMRSGFTTLSVTVPVSNSTPVTIVGESAVPIGGA